MDRIDGKGHHPRIRVKNWTDKIRSKRRKHVIKIVMPATRQLVMLRTETGYSTTKTDRYGYGVGIVVDAQLSAANIASLTTTDVEVGCSDAGTWYVDTKGCSMQQATPSNSPPRHGFVRNLMRYAASILLIALMAFLAACHKDPTPEPQPNPNQPTDTITPNDTITPGDTIPPIVPTREIVIPWSWAAGEGIAPPKDTIKFYTDDPTVKYVFIHLIPIQNIGSTWRPIDYHLARDTLQTRLDIDTSKVRGRGVVKVGRDGAHIHPDTLSPKHGMWEPDSVWFDSHGWQIQRFYRSK